MSKVNPSPPGPSPDGEYRCTACNLRFEKAYWLMKHRKTIHPELRRASPGSKNVPPPPKSAIDLMLEGKALIKEAIRVADLELATMHDRTNQLADLIASGKKLL